MNIFKYLNYTKIIEESLKELRKVDKKVNQINLAKAIEVHSPFLSRVLSQQADLSADQLFKVCEFFGWNEKQTEYMHLLLEHARTALPIRKKNLRKQIERIQDEELNVKKVLDVNAVGKNPELKYLTYYSHPLYSLVHSFMHIKKFQTTPLLLTDSLNISEEHLKKIIQDLSTHEFIKWDQSTQSYQVLQNDMHLEAGSPLVGNYRSMMRLASIQQIQSLREDHLMAFSVTMTIDAPTKKAIQAELLQSLERIKDLVEKSKSEEVLQMNIDFFPWLRK